MGFLDTLMGRASEVDVDELKTEFDPILGSDERIVLAFKQVRDMFVFTTRRLMLVDRQGMTGKKVEYLTIPYKSIRRFSVETAGSFDMDADLKLWVAGVAEPITYEVKSANAVAVQRALADHALG